LSKISFKEIIIKKLSPESAVELSQLLQNENPEYIKYFIPFNFDVQTISKKLNSIKDDCYFGIFIENKIAGFYMLRGFDEGYKIPSYGVWISKKFSKMGLSKLTLQHAVSFCQLNRIKELMLKVHPDNLIAKKIYENFGFKQSGIDPQNSNLIYYKKLL
jgi:RimJ/RimL family protein N-acetyltransferase